MEPVTIDRVLKMQLEAAKAAFTASVEAMRPSVLFKAALRHDGARWLAEYSCEQHGTVAVIGLGETPARAMQAFDIAWESAKFPPLMPSLEPYRPDLR